MNKMGKGMNIKKIAKILMLIIIIAITSAIYMPKVNAEEGIKIAASVGGGGANRDGESTSETNSEEGGTSHSTGGTQAKDISITDIINAGTSWIKNGEKSQPGDTNVDDFAIKFIGVGQVLVAIGVVTLLIVSLITAIKWITATPDKQAKLKQQLIGLVISAVVIFGAIGIWNLVRGIMESVEVKLAATTVQVQQIDNKI